MGLHAVMLVRVAYCISNFARLDLRKRLRDAFPEVSDLAQISPGRSNATVLEVVSLERYYGKGYERGRPYLLVAIAEWLEINIHDAVVYYGSDADAEQPPVFDAGARKALMAHFYEVGHFPYHAQSR